MSAVLSMAFVSSETRPPRIASIQWANPRLDHSHSVCIWNVSHTLHDCTLTSCYCSWASASLPTLSPASFHFFNCRVRNNKRQGTRNNHNDPLFYLLWCMRYDKEHWDWCVSLPGQWYAYKLKAAVKASNASKDSVYAGGRSLVCNSINQRPFPKASPDDLFVLYDLETVSLVRFG